jgi:Leucine-rich repeat (LRR) protein
MFCKFVLYCLENCNKITLIPLIVEIPFVKLISLDLSNNSLTSIDGLSNFNAPQLKEIRICNNFVTRIKNLRRGDWPNLKFLNLST